MSASVIESDDLPAGPVNLDTDTEPWVATFPGLGTVLVAVDGQVTINVTDGAETDERFESLRWGWADPLSWFRRGYDLTGAGVKALDGRGLIVVGTHPQDVAVLRALSEIGWEILADSMTPIRETSAGFEICHRDAPVLVGAPLADKWGFAASPVRSDSDVVAIELPRGKGPVAVTGVLQVLPLGLNDPRGAEQVSGTSRLQLATGIVRRAPASAENLDATAIVVRDMKLAQLPMARLHVADGQIDVDVSEVVRWWAGTQ